MSNKPKGPGRNCSGCEVLTPKGELMLCRHCVGQFVVRALNLADLVVDEALRTAALELLKSIGLGVTVEDQDERRILHDDLAVEDEQGEDA